MKSDFELILEECLAQMRTGKTLEECLSTHPAQAEMLRPLLGTAARVWEIPVPRARPVAILAGRERLLASAHFQKVAPIPVSSGRFARYTDQVLGTLKTILLGKTHSSLNLAFRLGAVFVLVLLATGAVTVKASASSLPGDRLYSVKRTWENARLSLTLDQQRKQRLQEQFAVERRDEVKEMIQLRRAGTVEFQAPLEGMDAEYWQVDGFRLHIDSATEVDGDPETGTAVEIRARLEADGTLIAIQVRAPAGTQPAHYPMVTPTPDLTPQSEGDSDTQGLEVPQNHPALSETPYPTDVSFDDENNETDQPPQQLEPVATHTPQFHQTRTPEHSEDHEIAHTPKPTEAHEAPHPTEQHDEPREPTHVP